MGTLFLVPVTLTELFVTGDPSGLLEAQRMRSKISDLDEHYLTVALNAGWGDGSEAAQDSDPVAGKEPRPGDGTASL